MVPIRWVRPDGILALSEIQKAGASVNPGRPHQYPLGLVPASAPAISDRRIRYEVKLAFAAYVCAVLDGADDEAKELLAAYLAALDALADRRAGKVGGEK